jgi:hypothetical protein
VSLVRGLGSPIKDLDKILVSNLAKGLEFTTEETALFSRNELERKVAIPKGVVNTKYSA